MENWDILKLEVVSDYLPLGFLLCTPKGKRKRVLVIIDAQVREEHPDHLTTTVSWKVKQLWLLEKLRPCVWNHLLLALVGPAPHCN